MTDPTPSRSDLNRALNAPLVEDRDLDFAAPLERQIARDGRKTLLLSFLWRLAVVGSIALLMAASTAGGFYLARLGAKAIVGH